MELPAFLAQVGQETKTWSPTRQHGTILRLRVRIARRPAVAWRYCSLPTPACHTNSLKRINGVAWVWRVWMTVGALLWTDAPTFVAYTRTGLGSAVSSRWEDLSVFPRAPSVY